MNLLARQVLSDCKKAHALLEDEVDPVRFRLFWIAGVALLRTVGHVLHKIDANQNPSIRLQIKQAYLDWKVHPEANAIFLDFIQSERNSLLKEYEIGFIDGPINLLVESKNEFFTLNDNLFCPIASGRYAGEDGRDVMEEAIIWWEKQLDSLEA